MEKIAQNLRYLGTLVQNEGPKGFVELSLYLRFVLMLSYLSHLKPRYERFIFPAT